MGNYKGSGLAANRDILRAVKPDSEPALLESMTAEERQVYLHAIPVAKYPAPLAAAIFEKTAQAIFPGDSQAVFKVGRERGKRSLTGIYKIFLKVTTIPYLISKSSKLWSAFHDQGEMSVARVHGKNEAVVTLTGYPELPRCFMDTTAGVMTAAMELAGAKNIRIDIQSDRNDPWTWIVSWEE